MFFDLIVNRSGKCPLDWTYPQCSAVKCRPSSSFKNSPSKYVLSSFVFSHSIRYLVYSRQLDEDFDTTENFPDICPGFIQITSYYEAYNKIILFSHLSVDSIWRISSRWKLNLINFEIELIPRILSVCVLIQSTLCIVILDLYNDKNKKLRHWFWQNILFHC